MANCFLSGFIHLMCLKAVLLLALSVWQFELRAFCSCPIYIELTRLFAFLLADLYLLKSISYLQVSTVLLYLIIYVVLGSRNTGDVKQVGKKGVLSNFSVNDIFFFSEPLM